MSAQNSKSMLSPLMLWTAVCLFLALPQQQVLAQELYSTRPQIENLESKPLLDHEKPQGWDGLKKAMVFFLSEILALYKNHEIFILARDGEYIFDLARVLLKENSETLAQIKLLNISRANMRAENVKDYLAQNGISDAALQNKKIVLIDTGFAGTIPSVIKSYFDPQNSGRIKTHLVASANPSIPSGRVFLGVNHKNVLETEPDKFHEFVIDYERLPHYTSKANSFEHRNGEWIPTAEVEAPQALKEGNVKLTQDLKSFGEHPNTKMLFRAVYASMAYLSDVAQGERALNSASVQKANSNLKRLGVTGFLHDLKDAVLSNTIAAPSENLAGIWGHIPEGEPKLLRLATVKTKMQWIETHPHLAPYLEKPEETIPKLNVDDYKIVYQLIEVDDFEIKITIIEKLLIKNGWEKHLGIINKLKDSKELKVKEALLTLLLNMGCLDLLKIL